MFRQHISGGARNLLVDPFMLDETEYLRWISMARATLKSAEGDLERGDYNWACFKAQQSAEFSLKALHHGLGLSGYGHSLSRLLMELRDKGLRFDEVLIERAKALDKLYVPTRYPNAWAEGAPHEYYTRSDAEEAIRAAREIMEWVEEVWRSLSREGV